MDQESLPKQFSLRWLFRWTLLAALIVALVQRLGPAAISLFMIIALFMALTGIHLIVVAAIFAFSIVRSQSIDSENLSRCKRLTLIGAAMCLPFGVLLGIFGLDAWWC